MESGRGGIQAVMAELYAQGKLSPGDMSSIERLLSSDDLISAQECLDVVDQEGRLPHPVALRPPINGFFPDIPDFLAKLTPGEIKSVPDQILQGVNLGPLAFSSIPRERREEARTAYQRWRAVKNAFNTPGGTAKVMSTLMSILDMMGAEGKIVSIENGRAD